MEKTVLNVFDKRDAPADPQNIEACHILKSQNNQSNKIIVKFTKHKDIKDMVRVMNKKKSLKNVNLGSTGLSQTL